MTLGELVVRSDKKKGVITNRAKSSLEAKDIYYVWLCRIGNICRIATRAVKYQFCGFGMGGCSTSAGDTCFSMKGRMSTRIQFVLLKASTTRSSCN